MLTPTVPVLTGVMAAAAAIAEFLVVLPFEVVLVVVVVTVVVGVVVVFPLACATAAAGVGTAFGKVDCPMRRMTLKSLIFILRPKKQQSINQ